jgi:uncharacterized membrane protein YeaQ/YmgE (transglycosylase-associated protein family)
LWEIVVWNIIWIIIIGFIAGLIARVLSPGPNEPKGFILTAVLGIAGAFVATFIGQTIGWYRLDQGAGLIGATLGALIVLFIWNRLVVHRIVRDPGVPAESTAPPPGRGP